MIVIRFLKQAEAEILSEGADVLVSDATRKLLEHIQAAISIHESLFLKDGASEPSYRNMRLRPRQPTYADIAVSHIMQCQRPVTTYELIDATKVIYPTLVICEGSLKSFRVCFSKDLRLKSVIWKKQRHWWLTHQALPAD